MFCIWFRAKFCSLVSIRNMFLCGMSVLYLVQILTHIQFWDKCVRINIIFVFSAKMPKHWKRKCHVIEYKAMLSQQHGVLAREHIQKSTSQCNTKEIKYKTNAKLEKKNYFNQISPCFVVFSLYLSISFISLCVCVLNSRMKNKPNGFCVHSFLFFIIIEIMIGVCVFCSGLDSKIRELHIGNVQPRIKWCQFRSPNFVVNAFLTWK